MVAYHRPAPALDHSGHGGRRRLRLPAAASRPRRSRRRSSPATTRRADIIAEIRAAARPRRAAVAQFGRWVWQPAARRSRHLDVLERAGDDLVGQRARADHLARLHDAARRRHDRAGDRRAGAAARVGTLDRPPGHGLRRVRLLGAGLRRRLPADLLFRDRAALAAGAGLHADRRGHRAVAAQPRPAVGDARPRLCRADRAHHPRHHARRAGRGLHPHGARPRASRRADAAAPRAEERRRADRHRRSASASRC